MYTFKCAASKYRFSSFLYYLQKVILHPIFLLEKYIHIFANSLLRIVCMFFWQDNGVKHHFFKVVEK